MTVIEAWTGGKWFKITRQGYNSRGQFFQRGNAFDPSNRENLMTSSSTLISAKKPHETPANFYLDIREEHIVEIND